MPKNLRLALLFCIFLIILKQFVKWELKLNIVDESAISHVINVGGKELLEELINMFDDMGTKIERAKEACCNGTIDDVYLNVHTLRSGASNLGLLEVLNATSVIEKKIKLKNVNHLNQDLVFLEQCYVEAKKQLKIIFSKL